MKQIILFFGLFTLLHTQSLAYKAPLPTSLLQSFYKSFAEAEDVSWDQSGMLTVASFFLQGKKKFAYYNERSELVVLAEPIAAGELPQKLRKNLEHNFRRYSVSGLFLLKDAQGTSYHAIFDNVKEKLIAKNNGGHWEVQKLVRK